MVATIPERARLSTLLPLLAATSATLLACRSAASPEFSGPELRGGPGHTLPLAEVSGITLAGPPGALVLFAVGDADRALVRLPWSDPPTPAAAQRIALPLPVAGERGAGSQLEAVALDADGRLLVLDEARGLVHVVDLVRDLKRGAAARSPETREVDDAVGRPRGVGRRVAADTIPFRGPKGPPAPRAAGGGETDPDGAASLRHTYRLRVPAAHPLADAWADDPNKRGEGLLVLPGGHLLVAKQRAPVALIEFGPVGDRPQGVSADAAPAAASAPAGATSELVPLAFWEADDAAHAQLASINDLARAPDGGLYLIASRPRAVLARVQLPLSPATSALHLDASWPVAALGRGKAEGLAFLPDGRALVAFDAKRGAANLVVLPAPR